MEYFRPIADVAGLGAVVLLILVLTIEEMIRVSDKRRGTKWITALTITIVPLLAVFGLVVGLRLAKLLHLF
jgi:hypothetical protein